ncbi:MAG: TatD family hydrolase [Phycisphaerae bacterium]|nr:TatD family hydrolase [Phycisphaerae bacterium]
MGTLIDSHAHLTDHRLLSQIDDVINRARAGGLAGILTIGTRTEDNLLAGELAERYPDVWAAGAIHPHDSAKFSPDMLPALREFLARPRVVALGEIGLDYHYDFAPRDVQHRSFEAQLMLAAELGKPVIIHSREAIADTLAIVARLRAAHGPIRGVFHSFTGTADEAKAILEAGFFLSLSGVVTFKKSDALHAVARLVPADRLLLETDSPYLSPEPMRRVKVNEPALLVHTLAKVAELRDGTRDSLAEQTARNVEALFGIHA